jgi:hypothetical protein
VLLADGGHAKAEDIAATRRMGVDVIVPPAEKAKTIEKLKAEGADPECGFPRSSTARPSRSSTALRQPFPGLATAVADPEEIAETGKPRAR